MTATRARCAGEVDESSVEAFLLGEMRGVHLTGGGPIVERLRAARREAVRRLTAAGRSAREISVEIGCHQRIVVRARAALRS